MRGVEWGLTREQVEKFISDPCFYCGRMEATTTRTTFGDMLKHNGMDRIDSSLGYTTANVVTCCKTCNQAKNVLSLEEFRHWGQQFAARIGAW